MAITIIILVLSAVFFMSGKVRSDLVALCALVLLILFNILTPEEALSGFSNSVVIMMVGLFVVGGAIFQTGLAKMISSRILKFAGTSELKLFILIILVTAAIGAFVSNTGTVALMLPIVVSMAMSANINVSRLLMPLAFASSMGGMMTLIGTPPNLVIQNALIEAGYERLSFFTFTPVGLVCVTVGLIVLIPLASVLVYSLKISPGEFFSLLWKSNVRNAFLTSIGCSLVAAGINTVFGVIVAWTLVKYDFPGKRIVDGLIELPFALPTAVAGITLSKLYSETGFFGKMLAGIGIKVTYTKTGLVIALVFVGLPFVIRAVQPDLEKLHGQYEEAAYMLGASPSKTFRRVILPELRPAILTGFGLALARGIGEYGSVIYISGNSAKEKTQVVSYVIMQKLSYIDYESATAIALVMLVLSFVLLLFVNIVQARQAARTNLL